MAKKKRKNRSDAATSIREFPDKFMFLEVKILTALCSTTAPLKFACYFRFTIHNFLLDLKIARKLFDKIFQFFPYKQLIWGEVFAPYRYGGKILTPIKATP